MVPKMVERVDSCPRRSPAERAAEHHIGYNVELTQSANREWSPRLVMIRGDLADNKYLRSTVAIPLSVVVENGCHDPELDAAVGLVESAELHGIDRPDRVEPGTLHG